MKPISLGDLRPETGEFYLRSTDKSYLIRRINLDDKRWIRATIGEAEAFQKIFTEMRMTDICRIVWHQMSVEDKASFPATSREDINEDGVRINIPVSALENFMAHVNGSAEEIVILSALIKTLGVSNPILDEELLDQIKKKATPKDVKKQSKSAGDRSSTSSQEPTAGHGITSGRSPKGKSRSRLGRLTSGNTTPSL